MVKSLKLFCKDYWSLQKHSNKFMKDHWKGYLGSNLLLAGVLIGVPALILKAKDERELREFYKEQYSEEES